MASAPDSGNPRLLPAPSLLCPLRPASLHRDCRKDTALGEGGAHDRLHGGRAGDGLCAGPKIPGQVGGLPCCSRRTSRPRSPHGVPVLNQAPTELGGPLRPPSPGAPGPGSSAGSSGASRPTEVSTHTAPGPSCARSINRITTPPGEQRRAGSWAGTRGPDAPLRGQTAGWSHGPEGGSAHHGDPGCLHTVYSVHPSGTAAEVGLGRVCAREPPHSSPAPRAPYRPSCRACRQRACALHSRRWLSGSPAPAPSSSHRPPPPRPPAPAPGRPGGACGVRCPH